MALTQRLELRQGQSLVMTPQLQQAIKLLQLSNLELAVYVEQELERNPLLERDESISAGETENVSESDSASPEKLEAALAGNDFSMAADLDARQDDVYDSEAPAQRDRSLSDWTSVKSSVRIDGSDDELESALTAADSLKDHLLNQLSIAALSPELRLIAVALIDGIDEAGYLRVELGEIAERLGASHECVGAALRVLQGFEPSGVAARDLAESLRL